MRGFFYPLPALALASFASAADPTAEQLTFFENKVRPVLAEHCYQCHSEANGKRKGGLTLDTKAGWQKGGDSGTAAVIPGKPEESALIRAIRYADSDLTMPPKGEKLDAAKIADLETWVGMGAPDPRTAPVTAAVSKDGIADGLTEDMKVKAAKHRAFQPITDQAAPAVKNTAWPVNEIDNFVLAKLEEHGLAPSAEADRRTLIRRAYLDVTGLPPSPDEVLAFVNDAAPDAFEKVVDGLLASPRYGERQGRHWLDVARYADTRGRTRRLETPLDPNAWTYRDYVIESLNADKPFNQFIREQLAADLITDRKDDPTLAALGFLSQGDQFAGNRQDVINDQIDVVTKGFLGLTVTCARCHDHFFDPIPQRDYYALHGIFNSTHEPVEKPAVVKAANPGRSEDYESARIRVLEAGRGRLLAEIDRTLSLFNRNAGFVFSLAAAGRQTPEFFELLKAKKLEGRVANELARLLRGVTQGGRRKVPHPVFMLLGEANRLPKDKFSERIPALLERARRMPRLNDAVVNAFRDKTPQSMEEFREIYASVFTRADEAWSRESAAWREKGEKGLFPGLSDPALEEVRTALLDPAPYREGELPRDARGLPRDLEDVLNRTNGELAKLEVGHNGAPGMANVLADDPKPRNSPVFLRGQIQNPGPVVPRRFLEFLAGPELKPYEFGSGRLELADSIVNPSNPLTARVIVNRVWMHHFGEGLVSTPDDFGVMSEAPSHPELLDHLAARFMAEGWSLKKLHRSILLSRTWRQSSEPSVELAKTDPFNRLLGRQNVRRLDFEALRDTILSVGGKLDTTMGGHPVNIESEPYSRRRSVYGFIDRNEMAEFMRHFDVANPALPTGRRHETIVPQQALFRMNSLLVIEQARNLMEREDIADAPDDAERLDRLYEVLYQRRPVEKERALAMEFIRATSAVTEEPADDLAEPLAEEAPAKPVIRTKAELSRMTKPERQAYFQDQRRRARIAMAAKMKEDRRGTGAIKEAVRDPLAEKVDRSPLSAWERYAHALLMTNEMSYVN